MIKVNLDKAKDISHQIRRNVRQIEFKEYDILVTIPSYAVQAEAKRQEIRDKYAQIQIDIDDATDEQEVKEAINDLLYGKKL